MNSPCEHITEIKETQAAVKLIMPHLERMDVKQDQVLEKLGCLEGRIVVAEGLAFKPNNSFAGGLITAGGVIGFAIGSAVKPFLKPLITAIIAVTR